MFDGMGDLGARNADIAQLVVGKERHIGNGALPPERPRPERKKVSKEGKDAAAAQQPARHDSRGHLDTPFHAASPKGPP